MDDAMSNGRVSTRVYRAVVAWHERTVDALAAATDYDQETVARQATWLREAICQLHDHGPQPALRDLIEDGRQALALADLDVVLLKGVSDEPTTWLLEEGNGVVALIFDGLRFNMSGNKQGLIFHEMAHANPHVRAQGDDGRVSRKKRAEAMADLIALAIGGTGFAGALRSLYEIADMSPEQELPNHPSFATREDILRTRAGAWWPAPYAEEVVKLVAPMRGAMRDQELRRKADVDEGHIRTTIANGKIAHEAVYQCRQGERPCSPRVRLSADLRGDL
ncbi:MAG TPA: hypothetical protein VM286_08255 [Candidatus Thermoplasmatota archaeon]|nr:hypothetical protein [Candidatus Thermoplasmatota archaeon]